MSNTLPDSHHQPLGNAIPGPLNELYIFLVVTNDGTEAILSYQHPQLGTAMMVAGTIAEVEQLRPLAQEVLRGTVGISVKVVRFIPAETVEEFFDTAQHESH